MIRVAGLILSLRNATVIRMPLSHSDVTFVWMPLLFGCHSLIWIPHRAVLLASLIRTSQCRSHSRSFGFSHLAGFHSGLIKRDSLVSSNMIRVTRRFVSLFKATHAHNIIHRYLLYQLLDFHVEEMAFTTFSSFLESLRSVFSHSSS